MRIRDKKEHRLWPHPSAWTKIFCPDKNYPGKELYAAYTVIPDENGTPFSEILHKPAIF